MAEGLVHREKMWRYAVDNFIRISSQIQKKEYINYIPNKIDRQCYDAFYDYFEKEKQYIGEDFVLKFIEFGFQSWYNNNYEHKVERVYSKGIRMSWVLSLKAVKRWNKLGYAINVNITRKNLKKKYKIVEKQNNNDEEYRRILISVRNSEEIFKSLSHNTYEGFANCIYYTTLYNHKSDLCKQCYFTNECKILLKENFHRIYKIRGYGNC
jgi:hypothetical protein